MHRATRALLVFRDSLALKDQKDQKDLLGQKDTEEKTVLPAHLEILEAASLLLVFQVVELKGTRAKRESR